jgi:cytochrome oxidase assembly protein ShyY1
MLWGAIASFALAFVMAILVGLGIWHASRTPEEERLLGTKPAAIPAT